MQSKAAGLYKGTVVMRSGPADNIRGGSEREDRWRFWKKSANLQKDPL